MLNNKEIKELSNTAIYIRRKVVAMAYESSSSHVGAALSMVDILTVLYFKRLNISPENFCNPCRDKFILSKGHGASALFAVLAKRGFFDEELLGRYSKNGSLLAGHPKKDSVDGVEVSTGSLGHGLAIGCGFAIVDKSYNRNSKTVVLLGDGECNEGSIWEAAMFASGRNLNNLIGIIDCNKLQGFGKSEEVTGLFPLDTKWKSFGWNVIEINGHDYNEIDRAMMLAYNNEKPTIIIANTIKGRGISFMENKLEWHYKSPNEQEYKLAMKELF